MNDRLEFDSVEIAFGGRTILSSIYMSCEKGQITGVRYLTLRKALSLFAVSSDCILEDFPEFEAMMDMRPSEMSGGYLRIFEVLMVLWSRAEFCLLDEPFTGLTPMYVDRMKQILKRVKEEKGLIITDHMHRHVVEVSDRMYLLVNGQTYHVKSVEQLVSLGYLHHV